LQTLAVSKETFTQPQSAGFTDNKEKLKADLSVCYNYSKAGYLKYDCSEPQWPSINHIKIELYRLEKGCEKELKTENSNA
jgi:hypothetical protein